MAVAELSLGPHLHIGATSNATTPTPRLQQGKQRPEAPPWSAHAQSVSTGFPGSWHQDAPPSPSAAARPGTTRRVDVDLDLVWEIWIFGGERPDGAHWRHHHPGRRSLPPSRTNSARDAAEWCGGEEHHELARARTPQRDDRGPLGPDRAQIRSAPPSPCRRRHGTSPHRQAPVATQPSDADTSRARPPRATTATAGTARCTPCPTRRAPPRRAPTALSAFDGPGVATAGVGGSDGREGREMGVG